METVFCIYCRNTSTYKGWTGLCNRKCYHGLCNLLAEYDTNDIEPDHRIVEYFTLYSKMSHSFVCKKNSKFSTYDV